MVEGLAINAVTVRSLDLPQLIAACERHIGLKGPGPSAYYLMGMICQAAGDRRRAEECFHKTVYLDPKHDEALLALSLLAERRGTWGK